MYTRHVFVFSATVLIVAVVSKTIFTSYDSVASSLRFLGFISAHVHRYTGTLHTLQVGTPVQVHQANSNTSRVHLYRYLLRFHTNAAASQPAERLLNYASC